MECIDVTLERKLFHKVGQFNRAGVPFLIGRTTSGQTIKGEMRKPSEYTRYRLWGEWRAQKNRNESAFEFVSHEEIIEETASGFAQYLTNNVDRLGPVKSRALVDEFGSDILKVLRETPDDAARVKGITPEIIESIRTHFANATITDPLAYAKVVEMFAGHRIPKRIVKAVLEEWGSDAPQMLAERPYLLLAYPGLGWKTVDSFAQATAKYPPSGIDRHKAAIVEALERLAMQGHTWGTLGEIEGIAYPLIGGIPTEQAWEEAEAANLIVTRGRDCYALPKIASAEETIATRLATLASSAIPLPFSLDDTGLLAGQREALRLIEKHGVVILAGAPGTGKTYTITTALAGLVANGFSSIRIVTPTGKAAKRASELLERALPDSGIQASTIHRALGPIPSSAPEGVPAGDAKQNRGRDEFGFYHNEENPLEAEVLVVDEASMLDVLIGSSLIKAVASGTRVIFVGDPNQLPSVGPGSVLRDLIAAGVPTATLTEVQRNCGTIVRACHDIMAGRTPVPAARPDLANGDNWIHVELDDPKQIAQRIVELHKSVKSFDPIWEMQVISPEKGKEGVGCNDLNRMLSDALNTWKQANQHAVPDDERVGFDPIFSCGDKVVRTKNGLCDLMTKIDRAAHGVAMTTTFDSPKPDWLWDGDGWKLTETDIVNGDMGDVVDICQQGDNTYVVVDFKTPNRRCRLPYAGCELIPAYAMTCHKAQGSGFPYVILPVHHAFYYDPRTGQGLWNREMIYTMFSRAERLLVTVGQYSAIESAVSRRTVGQRKTRLQGLVAGDQSKANRVMNMEALANV